MPVGIAGTARPGRIVLADLRDRAILALTGLGRPWAADDILAQPGGR
jgi:hypothetical protein